MAITGKDKRVIVVPAADAGAIGQAGQPMLVKKILWNKPTTADHAASLTDGTDTLWAANAVTAKQDIQSDFIPPLEITKGTPTVALQSGTLYIYLH